jgi:subtilisin-like proprotein convertase family protein
VTIYLRFAAFLLGCVLSHAATVSYSGPGGDIPDYDPSASTPSVLVSDIIITDEARLVNDVTVTIVGLQHSFIGDLIATLSFQPAGVLPPIVLTRSIFSRIGAVNPGDFGSNANFDGNYSFNSAFSNDIWTMAATLGDVDSLPFGNYWPGNGGTSDPNDMSSFFNGLPADGKWELTMSDNSSGDVGSFLYWTLTLDVANTATAEVPEPAYFLLTGIVAAALLVKRGHPLLTKSRGCQLKK